MPPPAAETLGRSSQVSAVSVLPKDASGRRGSISSQAGSEASEKRAGATNSVEALVTTEDQRSKARGGRFATTEEVFIHRGRFSWRSAFFMCLFIVTGFSSSVLMCLSLQETTALSLIGEEISYINTENPPWPAHPWGYVKQPNDATERKVGQPFRYAMPATVLFWAIASASFGLFTVAYFCSELLVQDLGITRVKEIGDVINRGVRVYVSVSVPIMLVFMSVIAIAIYLMVGPNFVISMLTGASTCLFCANLGTSMNFEGGPRLTHAMNYDLNNSVQLGIRTGAIGGLSAHAIAQLGVVLVWIIVGDANALVGFGTGVSIVAFYNRVGGGIFSKGSDIGSDFVSVLIGEDDGEEQMQEAMEQIRKVHEEELSDADGDDCPPKPSVAVLANNTDGYAGHIHEKEAKLRHDVEEQMEANLKSMHPVKYLDAIGENIADIGGTSSDLFETMCITLATSVILGAKAHEVPYLGTGLPFNIISTGTLGCALACYYVWCHDKHSHNRIRNALRLNLLFVIVVVQGVASTLTFTHYYYYHTISFSRMIQYDVIIFLGLCSPELCALICEFFTSVNFPPVALLARDADLGMIQVVLQGLGQGFVSAGAPSVVNIIVQIIAFTLEGWYGLVLLACASQACTGWQATIAAFGAVANNATSMVHMTTVDVTAHHRGHVCAVIGTTTSHNGKCVAGQVAFFATSALVGALMADKYTKLGEDYTGTTGQRLGQFTRAGLLAGIIFTMLFLANTLTGCIQMAKNLVKFCAGNSAVAPRADREFPATHIVPLKILVRYTAIESFRHTISPLLQSFAAPLVIGQLFGFEGLLMLVSGGNSVCFSLNMFLINAGQAWDAARKYILFGMLKDEFGVVVGADSEVYETLGIGEQIGGPLEDLTGPALNNFIKFVAVGSFVTSDLYDMTPENTWMYGVVQVIINFTLVSFFKFGLRWSMQQVDDMVQKRRDQQEYEEGTHMLREIEKQEARAAEQLALGKAEDDAQLVDVL